MMYEVRSSVHNRDSCFPILWCSRSVVPNEKPGIQQPDREFHCSIYIFYVHVFACLQLDLLDSYTRARRGA
jgi:hypothetical protein